MRSLGLRRGWAFAALILLAAMPSAGQPDPSAPPAFPSETLVPNDDARAFFESFPSHILTGDVLAGMSAEETRPVDEVIEQTLTRGEQVQSWQSGGVDLRAIVGAREGGHAGNIAAGVSQFGPNLVYYLDRPIDEFVPDGLVLVARHGEPIAGENVQVEIGHLSPKVVLAQRIAYRREGNAYCSLGGESRLYADPAVSASEADTVAVVMTMRFLSALDRTSLCQVVEEREPGQYVTRLFDAEGFRLPALDAVSTAFRIVPRTPRANQPSPR